MSSTSSASAPSQTNQTHINTPPVFINSESITSILTPNLLISHLHTTLPLLTYPSSATPSRHFHTVSSSSSSSSLLLMPSFSSHPALPYIGVKLLTHFPSNSPLPSIHASYTLFSSVSGIPLAFLDGTLLTLFRTSAISALASSFLSRRSSSTLVVVGSGALSPHLIMAHLSARPNISTVLVWNRTPLKAQTLIENLRNSKSTHFNETVRFEVVDSLEDAVREGDIISCATSSEEPLVKGEWLKCGAHLDLVGSYRRDMRECDDVAMGRAKGMVYVDCEAAVEEAGEVVGAVERGVLGKEDVAADLTELVMGVKAGRRTEEDVTVFKSVGNAGWDLVTAQLVYEEYIRRAN